MDRAPKSCKLHRKVDKNRARGYHFGPPSAMERPHRESLDHLGDTIAVNGCSSGVVFRISYEMCDMWISMPFPSGIAVCAGAGDRVGAPGGKSSTEKR